MSKNKIGVFSALLFGVMMLLIPATSIASAQEYGDRYGKVNNDIYYKDDRYYKEKEKERERHNDYGYGSENNDRHYDDYRQTSYDKEYKKVDKKENDRPVIIVKNKIPVPHQDKEKKKEPPMVLVNKEVLFCDLIANGTNFACSDDLITVVIPEPTSDRWVQECTSQQCQDIDASSYDIKLENANIFEGSEQGTKLNLEVGRYMVTEENTYDIEGSGQFDLSCQNAGFDEGVIQINSDVWITGSCVLFEGECSGIVQDGELKECTVNNYVVFIEMAAI